MSSRASSLSGKGRAPQSADAQGWTRTCPACATEAGRITARFCATCGRALEGGYFPADTLRASYHQRHQHPVLQNRLTDARRHHQVKRFFSVPNRNNASTTALAFVTYALVPYLGILFCPGAVLMGSIGLLQSYRAPQAGGRRASALSIVLGLLILCIQIFLWWILYKVPQWTQP
jgi:hypothetical protein